MLKRFVIAFVALLMSAQPDAAVPIPAIGLNDLLRQSDIIVVGRFADISDIGPTIVEGITSRGLSAMIHVDEVIKGEVQASTVRIRYAEPQEPIGYRGIASDSYGMFFLRHSAAGIEFASPYFPYVAAVSGFHTSAASPSDRVYEVVANVLRVDPSSANKLEAIAILRQSTNPIALDALRSTIGSLDQELVLRAAAALMSAGDLRALQPVEAALQGSRVGVSEETYATVLGALEELKEPSALGMLERLFVRGDAGTRRAAIRAMRRFHSQAAARSLVRALDDDDFDVRHNAVMGLSEAFGRPEWGPSVDAFADDERRYISLWKEWNKKRK